MLLYAAAAATAAAAAAAADSFACCHCLQVLQLRMSCDSFEQADDWLASCYKLGQAAACMP